MFKKSSFPRKFTARLVFIIGVFLLIFGITFLFSDDDRPWVSIFFALILSISGVVCAFLALKLNKQASYLFFASFFLMSGIFLFAFGLGVIPLPFSRIWPLLSVFSGLALLPVGWKRTGGFSTRYLVSSLFFVLMGLALLVFSLRIVPFSFRQFIMDWWPMLFVFGGLTLALVSLSARNIKDNAVESTEDSEEKPSPREEVE